MHFSLGLGLSLVYETGGKTLDIKSHLKCHYDKTVVIYREREQSQHAFN